MTTNIFERFDEKFHGNDKFPKRIADPILCDEIMAFLRSELENLKEECVGGDMLVDEYDVFKIGMNEKRQEVLEAFERRGI